MSDAWRPGERDRLAEIERYTVADDPRFAAGLMTLRPCPPREYRDRARRRVLVRTGCLALAGVAVLVAWLWLGWFVAALFGLESAVMTMLTIAGRRRDADAATI